MNCPRCQSSRLFQFEADKGIPAPITNLPVVCRDCGLVQVAGSPVPFPPELELQVKSMAELAATAGEQAIKACEHDPNLSIARYFSRVYRDGYLAGFWRAFLFLRHNTREGRIKRLRQLWKRVPRHLEADPETGKVYAEIDQLLALGDDHATGFAHQRSSESERPA